MKKSNPERNLVINTAHELDRIDEQGQIKRDEIIAKYGSIEKYQEALRQNTFVVSDDSRESQKLLKAVHKHLLTPLIPIDDERESVSGLRAIMRANDPASPDGKNITKQIGRNKEVWVVVLDPETGIPVAAGNTSMYSAKGKESEQSLNGTANNIYLLVNKDYRKLGLADYVMNERKEVVRNFLSEDFPNTSKGRLKFAMFNEQNKPDAMTLQDYFFDTKGAGIDQCRRQQVFTKAWGNKTCSFPYVQIALEGGEPCEGLMYNTLLVGVGPNDPLQKGLPSVVLKEGLQAFFTQSVAKGADYSKDPAWVKQQKFLEQNPVVSWAPPFDYAAYQEAIWGRAKQVSQENTPEAKKVFHETLIGEIINPASFVQRQKLAADTSMQQRIKQQQMQPAGAA